MVIMIWINVLLFLWMTLRDVQVYSLREENVVEIWREFVGYDLDLSLTPIISSPDVLVSNGNNDYSELLDGNLATCVHLNQTWCDVAVKVKRACVQHFSTEFLSFVALSIIPNSQCNWQSELFDFIFNQVKIWNTAGNNTNLAVTVVADNLECDVKNLLVYTGYDDVMVSGTITDRSHFHGNYKLLSLERSGTNGNGQKECMFRCEDMCHYVFISVQNVPDESSWKICEVLFK